jgi:hypothetical protein
MQAEVFAQKQMDAIVVTIVGCVAAAALLLLHHRYHHRTGGPAELHGSEQWFQCSDVGNCESWNHESFVLGFLSVAVLLAILKAFLASLNIFV